VQRGVSLLGGAEAFFRKGERILLKPNWIMAVPPERGATTHPSVFQAVCEVFQAAGADLCYGDSPGNGTSEEETEKAAKVTGFWDIAARLNVPLADFANGRTVQTAGIEPREFFVANAALDCDGIISLPKLKTHAMMKMTGAVKNQFGCIPGKRKGQYHAQIKNHTEFAQMLVDLNMLIEPRLYIMDGIVAMEGNGPMNGDPKKMNVMMFSTDPVALDAIACRLVALNPENCYTVSLGMKAKHGTHLREEIELLGDPLAGFLASDFKVNRDPIADVPLEKMPKPYIVEEKCVRCGVCVEMCPIEPKVVDWHNNDRNTAPSYDYDRCIRCYCCQEVCPSAAIFIEESAT
jgi:uncharacterized protein (DUF362 family)/Pyruvate/2-oxoacid:ferredoxin oxidoreductase delta subunit